MNALHQTYLVKLHTFLITYFNDDELRELCFHMNIDYHDLAGGGRADRARELVLYCSRRNILPKLVHLCCKSRPLTASEISDLPPALDSTIPISVVGDVRWKILLVAGFLVAIIILSFTVSSALWGSSNPSSISRTIQPTDPILVVGQSTFAGTWEVSEQSPQGHSQENWNIQVVNGTLGIQAFQEMVAGASLPGDYHEQLPLSNIQLNDQTLHVTIKRSTSVTVIYSLTIVDSNRIEGSYTSEDTGLPDTGAIQGDAGVIHDAGDVIMIRHTP